ncbi:MAG TPA: aminotransferase class III-fold pyridoxal phosphate-dependent enzyme [Ktedonobacteraceae bacterium]|nr:aminotransferase class III-fold pyridoxal phosphate-dependent enzyme [Ktedonobacteraceae bacterium]
MTTLPENAIAIIGMAGYFPGARNIEEFWQNLQQGAESITFFSQRELEEANIPTQLRELPNYRSAYGMLTDIEQFDASFFGFSPKEAELTDPQQRLLLECAWNALESAGYDPSNYGKAISVYAGTSPSTYHINSLLTNADQADPFFYGPQISFGNDTHFTATRISYKLNLHGPSISVNTACSTSLVAVHMACQSLLSGESDMALAGGASITIPQQTGYLYEAGSIMSADGHCRAFDAEAQGTVGGGGAGMVLLKRYDDAVADGDTIYALIRGSAINNDGSTKVGFTAPSVDYQARVIEEALALAEIEADTITYVEAHGTGTPMGDPIEIAALTQAFDTTATQYCALGSVKTNIGHLDAAAGIAGLIKTSLALYHKQIPPSINFTQPNPEIDFAHSPFYINTSLQEWPVQDTPRRAGVSSFGIGGTNAHIVLEEAPSIPVRRASVAPQLLTLSAKSVAALATAHTNLIARLADRSETPLIDIAHTLQSGRRAFDYRSTVVCTDPQDAIDKLQSSLSGLAGRQPVSQNTSLAFLFPGQGSQYVNMGKELYLHESTFRASVDQCAEILQPELEEDLRRLLYPEEGQEGEASRLLAQTFITQPALFTLEYALAQTLLAWNIRPQAMLGHSIGEFVAACLAGVLSLPEALKLVATRGKLMQRLPPGAMLAVPRSEEALRPFLRTNHLVIAAVNLPSYCVLAGTIDEVELVHKQLAAEGILCRRLQTSHAFHSPAMEAIVQEFIQCVAQIPLQSPRIPYISNVTGTWITSEEATNPGYWGKHLCQCVRFADGLQTLYQEAHGILLEVGPGYTLSRLARQHPEKPAEQVILASMHHPQEELSDRAVLLEAVGHLWENGISLNWAALHADEQRYRIPLPTYPFEKQRYWIEPRLGFFSQHGATVTQDRALSQHSARIERKDQQSEEQNALSTPVCPTTSTTRYHRIKGELNTIIKELSGIDLDEDDYTYTSFFERGFDSLFLVQISQAIRKQLGVEIALLQLFDELPTIDAIAKYLDEKMPSDEDVRAIPPAEKLQPSVTSDQGAQTVSQPSPHLQGNAVPQMRAEQFQPFKQSSVELHANLTASQQDYIETFIQRYNAKTRTSKQHNQTYRPYLADPRGSSGFKRRWKEMIYPLISERSAGSSLWDVDDNKYIDFAMGFGVHLFGHSPDFVLAAIETQLKVGLQLGPQSHLAGQVAQLICEMTGMERAVFCNSGTEAVMAALRIARTVTGRTRVALFSGSYHGTFDGTMARAVNIQAKHQSRPQAPGIIQNMIEDTLVLDYGDPASLIILQEHAHELAAILTEPIQSRRPDLQPQEFLHALRQFTQEHDIALIFDEIITGFRLHPGGAQAWFGVQADIATYGKVIGGGLPIGVVAGKAAFMDALDGGMWRYGDESYPQATQTAFAGTFSKHPLALATTLATLQKMQEVGPALQAQLNQRTTQLVATLNSFFRAEDVPIHVVHGGSLFDFIFAQEFRFSDLFFYALVEKGIYVWEGRTCFLSTAHSDEDLAALIKAVKETTYQLKEAGFFPSLPGEKAEEPAFHPSTFKVASTFAQRQILAACLLSNEASCAYNECDGLSLHGHLDLALLKRTLQALVMRHDALRTTFSPIGDYQLIHESMPIDILLVDVSDNSQQQKDARIEELCRSEQHTPFDLVHGPLLRVKCIQIGTDHHILLLTLHHLICDFWSYEVLINDLSVIYTAYQQGRQPLLPQSMPFSHYARSLEALQKSERMTRSEHYWLRQFEQPVPALDLPTDFPRPPIKTYRGALLNQELASSLGSSLMRLSAQYKCSLFMILLAAFELLLHRLSDADTIVVGIHAAGQVSEYGDKNLVGYCINILPIRSSLQPGATFINHLQATRASVLEAYNHAHYPFGQLIQKLKLPGGTDRTPLVSVVFNVDHVMSSLEMPGLSIQSLRKKEVPSPWDFNINAIQSDQGLSLECTYDTALFNEGTVREWLEQFTQLLEAISAQPESELQALLNMLKNIQDQQQARKLIDMENAAVQRLRLTKRKARH